jgi:plastocyanin
MGRETVVITYQDDACIVSPAEKSVSAGEQVTWSARGTRVTIELPKADVFGVYSLVVEDGEEETLTVQSGAKSGSYPYSILCHEGNCYAKGDSGLEPVIIIP